jgi:hypothetical protein
MLPQQHVAALRRVEEMRADQPVQDQDVLATMMAGMARMMTKEVTSIDQTKSGMRSSDMPGARCLNTVTTISTAPPPAPRFGEGDHLRPDVGALARAVLRPDSGT